MKQIFLFTRILKAFPPVRQYGHDDLLRLLHQHAQHPFLHRREIHKTVHRHDRSPYQTGLGQTLRQ